MTKENTPARCDELVTTSSINGTLLVTRQNAEEVIAAERAESERLRELLKTQSDAHAKHVKGLIAQHEREREIYGQAAQDFRQRAEKTEADNAAKDARIEELERRLKEVELEHTGVRNSYFAERRKASTLEADNERLREALEIIDDHALRCAKLVKSDPCARAYVKNILDEVRTALGEMKL